MVTCWTWIIAIEGGFCAAEGVCQVCQLLYAEKILQQAINLIRMIVVLATAACCMAMRRWVCLALAGVWMPARASTPMSLVMVVLVMMLSSVNMLTRARVATRSPRWLVPCEAVDETWSTGAPTWRLSLVEAVNHVSKVDGPILLILLICPPLDTALVQVLLFERIQKRVNLQLYLFWAFWLLYSRCNLDISRQYFQRFLTLDNSRVFMIVIICNIGAINQFLNGRWRTSSHLSLLHQE